VETSFVNVVSLPGATMPLKTLRCSLHRNSIQSLFVRPDRRHTTMPVSHRPASITTGLVLRTAGVKGVWVAILPSAPGVLIALSPSARSEFRRGGGGVGDVRLDAGCLLSSKIPSAVCGFCASPARVSSSNALTCSGTSALRDPEDHCITNFQGQSRKTTGMGCTKFTQGSPVFM